MTDQIKMNMEVFNQVTGILSLSENQLERINSRLPEYHRAKAMIGHGTSQSSYSLQTMNMISDSPLSRMKQCLAQIDKKYGALSESYFKIEKKKLRIKELQKNSDTLSRLNIRECESQIDITTSLMEAALREIGLMQNMYDSIMKNNNIPQNWTEKDYEKQEIENMIRSSFRIAIQDLSAQGRISRAAVEYWEQLGIHPQLGEQLTREYLTTIQMKINDKEEVTIQEMYLFLDSMVKKFKESWKLAIKRMGLDELGAEEFMATGQTKPR